MLYYLSLYKYTVKEKEEKEKKEKKAKGDRDVKPRWLDKPV